MALHRVATNSRKEKAHAVSGQFMKLKSGLGMYSANTQEMQLICDCCTQPYYSKKAREDRMQTLVLGAEKYAICPRCEQIVPGDIFPDERYRNRWRNEVARLQRLFESGNSGQTAKVNPVAEPTYEELKARIADLEKQKHIRSLQFKVRKGRCQCLWSWSFSCDALLRAMDAPDGYGARTSRFP